MAPLRARIVLPATAGVLLLAGCGDPATEPGAARPATTPAPTPSAAASFSTPAPVPSGTPPFSTPARVPSGGSKLPGPPPVGPTDLPTAGGKPITVDGIVEAGVEPGCRVLTAGATSYLIVGGKDVPTGVPVRVQGVPQPGVLTTCQQGTPLRVTDVQRR